MRRIRITAGAVSAVAELKETKTAEAIYGALPFRGRVSRWGEEIYFAIPLRLGEEDPQEVVAMGDLGYWPPGSAFCIFFGHTPASRGNEIRPASPVNVFGHLVGDPKVFKAVKSRTKIVVEEVES